MELHSKRVVITGGAGFIGSHVVDSLVAAENEVVIFDDFSTGKWENLQHHKGNARVHVFEGDIRDADTCDSVVKGADVVFHLAVACLRVSIRHPKLVHEINATGTLNVCQAAFSIRSVRNEGSLLYTPESLMPIYR